MIIRADGLAQFAIGTFGSEIRNGAWHPHRLPEAMRGLYGSELEAARVACPASVRLRFHTNSRFLHIALRYGRAVCPHFHAEAFVENERFVFGPEEATFDWAGTVFNLPTSHRRLVDIFLPGTCQVDVLGLKLDDGCTLEPAEPLPLRWLAYGGSITQGMSTRKPGSSYVNVLARELEAEVFNLAVAGATLVPQLAMTVPDDPINLVTVGYGSDDKVAGVPVSAFVQRARALAWAVREKHPKAHVVFHAMPRRLDEDVPNRIGHRFSDYIRALKPLEEEFPRLRVWIGDVLPLPSPVYLEDKAHPNDQGHEIFASHVIHAIRNAMRLK